MKKRIVATIAVLVGVTLALAVRGRLHRNPLLPCSFLSIYLENTLTKGAQQCLKSQTEARGKQ